MAEVMRRNAALTLVCAAVLLGAAAKEGVYFQVESAEERAKLPKFKTIPAAKTSELTPAARKYDPADYRTWERSHGDRESSRFSSLTQINRDNVSQLEPAWTYRSGDRAGNLQANPIIVDGVMYAPTPGDHIVAVDGATGKELWRFHAGDRPAFRGLTYWPGDEQHAGRLVFTTRKRLFALNVETGRPVPGFGDEGSVPADGTVAPAIWQNVIVAPLWNVVKGYDVRNGDQLWEFHMIPREGEFGYDTWDRPDDGANTWGGMALDDGRGIAYVATGSPHPNIIGPRHRGRNLFANCVIALDVKTGERLWHFQEIRHDIWDLDIPSPPNLVTVKRGGKLYDAVAAVTKIGNTLLLDRVTGKPLFDFRLRRAPTSTLPGELTWPYQPFLELPEPFAPQEFNMSEVTDVTPSARKAVLEQVEDATMGWFKPVELRKPHIVYGIHGGGQWTGAAFDPRTQRLYVNSNNVPWLIKVAEEDGSAAPDFAADSPGAKVYRARCALCHGEDMLGKGHAGELRNVRGRYREEELVAIVRKGFQSMPAVEGVSGAEQSALMDFLYGREAATRGGPTMDDRPNYYFYGFKKLLDDQGRPGGKPPWGLLNAINLNTGKIDWQVPLGEYPELVEQGIPITGTENFGGASVTAGGLVFVAGTRDMLIRAFDSDSGEELWRHKLPFGGFAPPAIYEADGRQFVVIAATGGGKLGHEQGDAWVAFAMPEKP